MSCNQLVRGRAEMRDGCEACAAPSLARCCAAARAVRDSPPGDFETRWNRTLGGNDSTYVHIHPFVDCYGGASRLLSTLCPYRAGYDFKRLFTLSEFYDRDRMAFYDAIQSVHRRTWTLAVGCSTSSAVSQPNWKRSRRAVPSPSAPTSSRARTVSTAASRTTHA